MSKPVDHSKNPLNRAYAGYHTDPNDDTLGRLLDLSAKSTYRRFVRGDGHEVAEEISLRAQLKLWRSLPGYPGPDPLRSYDIKRANWASFVTVVAKTTRLDYLDHLAAKAEEQYSPELMRQLFGERDGESYPTSK